MLYVYSVAAKPSMRNIYDGGGQTLSKHNMRMHVKEEYPFVITIQEDSTPVDYMVRYGWESIIIPISKIHKASVS